MIFFYKVGFLLSIHLGNLPFRITFNCSGFEWFIFNKTAAYDWINEYLQTGVDPYINYYEKLEISGTNLLKWVPIEIIGGKGSIVVGNCKLPLLMITDFRSVNGILGATPSRSKFDIYKSVLHLVFQTAKMQLRSNIDYEQNSADLNRQR
jgi:hypothetical protein